MTVSNSKSRGQARLREAETTYYGEIARELEMEGNEIMKLRWAKAIEDLENTYHDDGRDLSFAFGYDNPVIFV